MRDRHGDSRAQWSSNNTLVITFFFFIWNIKRFTTGPLAQGRKQENRNTRWWNGILILFLSTLQFCSCHQIRFLSKLSPEFVYTKVAPFRWVAPWIRSSSLLSRLYTASPNWLSIQFLMNVKSASTSCHRRHFFFPKKVAAWDRHVNFVIKTPEMSTRTGSNVCLFTNLLVVFSQCLRIQCHSEKILRRRLVSIGPECLCFLRLGYRRNLHLAMTL